MEGGTSAAGTEVVNAKTGAVSLFFSFLRYNILVYIIIVSVCSLIVIIALVDNI